MCYDPGTNFGAAAQEDELDDSTIQPQMFEISGMSIWHDVCVCWFTQKRETLYPAPVHHDMNLCRYVV